jgi:hypothetical protein
VPHPRALFSSSASKSARRFFTFWICFTPRAYALFEEHNYQKCSGPQVLLTFWLRHVLRATAACKYLFFIPPHGPHPPL